MNIMQFLVANID